MKKPGIFREWWEIFKWWGWWIVLELVIVAVIWIVAIWRRWQG